MKATSEGMGAHKSKEMLIISFVWVACALLYHELIQDNKFHFFAGLTLLISQSGTDICIALIALLLRHRSCETYKKFFLYIALAFIFEIFTDGNLNLNLYILNNFPLTNFLELSIEIPFFCFQLLLLCAHLQLLVKIEIFSAKNWLYSGMELVPFIFIITTVFYFFVFSFKWQIATLSLSGILQIIALILDLIIFLVSMLSLAISNEIAISSIASGSLVLIATDIIDRFGILSSSYLIANNMNIFWPLGLLIVLFGLLTLKKSVTRENKNARLLLPINSVKVQYTLWCFLVSVISLSAFLIVIYSYSSSENIFYHNLLVKYISSILIIFSAISVLLSNIFAKKMASPLQEIKLLLNQCTNTTYKEEVKNDLAILDQGKTGILEFNELSDFISKSFLAFREAASAEKKIAEISLQVAHDIRSPLTALDMVVKDMTDIPEEKRILVRNATKRIHDIANNLLSHYKPQFINSAPSTKQDNHPQLISDLILSVISEKKAQYRDLHVEFTTVISDQTHGCFANVSPSEFKRVLSNLINNAIEAIKHTQGAISINLSSTEDILNLIVKDNGCGISSDSISKIKTGYSTKNTYGHGLGLSSAIKMIETEWKGKFHLESYLDKGTAIEVSLPKAPVPKWFVSELLLDQKNIVILDDDDSIHQVWRYRLDKFKHLLNFVDMYSATEIISWHQKHSSQPSLFLIDHELIGSKISGLEIIKKLNIQHNSFLVTSRFDDLKMLEECDELNLKIIPKSYAVFIPIRYKNLL